MDDELRLVADLQSGVFSTDDARRLGYGYRAMRNAVDSRRWVRIRRGYYVMADLWQAANAQQRHLLAARAVVRPLAGRVALSHSTGALAYEIQHWQPRLGSIHVTRLDGRDSTVEHGVVHHDDRVDPAECVRLDRDFLVVPGHIAVVGSMRLHSLDQSVVLGDSAVHLGVTDYDLLRDLADTRLRTPSTRHVRLAIRLVDGDAESVGESLSRQVFWRGFLPRPKLQYEVHGPLGQYAKTDFGWEDHGVVGEFDGKVKYQRGMRPDETPSDVVVREKKREEWIVETGVTMRRLIWSELFTPSVTVERFRRALDAGRRYIA